MPDDNLPEPETTGVNPVQTARTEELELVRAERGSNPAVLLSSAIENNYARGLGSTNVALLVINARQLEQANAELRTERDRAYIRADELRERLSAANSKIARLEERLSQGPSLALATSIMQIIGGTLLGAGLGQSLSAWKPIAGALIAIGLVLIVASMVLIWFSRHTDH